MCWRPRSNPTINKKVIIEHILDLEVLDKNPSKISKKIFFLKLHNTFFQEQEKHLWARVHFSHNKIRKYDFSAKNRIFFGFCYPIIREMVHKSLPLLWKHQWIGLLFKLGLEQRFSSHQNDFHSYRLIGSFSVTIFWVTSWYLFRDLGQLCVAAPHSPKTYPSQFILPHGKEKRPFGAMSGEYDDGTNRVRFDVTNKVRVTSA